MKTSDVWHLIPLNFWHILFNLFSNVSWSYKMPLLATALIVALFLFWFFFLGVVQLISQEATAPNTLRGDTFQAATYFLQLLRGWNDFRVLPPSLTVRGGRPKLRRDIKPRPPEPRCTFVKEGLTLTVVAGADCWCWGSYFIEFPVSTNIDQPLLYSTCREEWDKDRWLIGTKRGTHIWRVYEPAEDKSY